MFVQPNKESTEKLVYTFFTVYNTEMGEYVY
jgi:hypothetical protein